MSRQRKQVSSAEEDMCKNEASRSGSDLTDSELETESKQPPPKPKKKKNSSKSLPQPASVDNSDVSDNEEAAAIEENEESEENEDKKEEPSLPEKKKKIEKIFNQFTNDISCLDNIGNETLTSRVVLRFKKLFEMKEIKNSELRKVYCMLWNYCQFTMNSGFISNIRNLGQICDKIENMILLNRRLFDETPLCARGKINAVTTSYYKDEKLNLYLLFPQEKDMDRCELEIIYAWDLMLVALACIRTVDHRAFLCAARYIKPTTAFTAIYNCYLDWFNDVSGGSEFVSKLRLLKKHKPKSKPKKDAEGGESVKLATKKDKK